MSISSRTPEGDSNRCPICDARVIIEPSEPTGDAPCPRCGHLLWQFRRYYSNVLNVAPERITADTQLLADDLGADSLDAVELVMEFEEQFDVPIPDAAAEKIRTVGDAIRYIVAERSRKAGESP